MFNESNKFILEDSFDEISFTFSEPEDQPKSIAVDLSNGSPLNPNDFIGVHYNINSLTALGRLDQLNHISRSLNLDYLVINESKLDTTIYYNLMVFMSQNVATEIEMVAVASSTFQKF